MAVGSNQLHLVDHTEMASVGGEKQIQLGIEDKNLCSTPKDHKYNTKCHGKKSLPMERVNFKHKGIMQFAKLYFGDILSRETYKKNFYHTDLTE